MKPRLVSALLLATMAGCGGGAATVEPHTRRPLAARPAEAAANPALPSATELLDWAERAYPQYFPSHTPDQQFDPYLYRYYPQTQNYLGVSGEDIFALGSLTGYQLLRVGTLGDWRCQVRPTDCVDPDRPRVVAGVAATVAIAADGRPLLLAVPNTAPDLPLLPGSTARVLPLAARSVAVGSGTHGALLGSDGRAWAWGQSGGWIDGGLLPAAAASPRLMVWPGSVRQVHLDSDRSATALLDDGSVWQSGELGDMQLTGNGWVYTPRRVRGLAGVKSLSRGIGPLHAVLADGSVADVQASTSVTRRVPGATAVRAVACAAAHCIALREDGTVLAWGHVFLGDGRGPSHRTDAAAVPGLCNVIQVAAAGRPAGRTDALPSDSAVLTADGRIWRWGAGDQLRYAEPITVPQPVPGLTDVAELSCASHCVVRRRDGTVWGWGLDVAVHFNVPGPDGYATAPIQAPGVLLP